MALILALAAQHYVENAYMHNPVDLPSLLNYCSDTLGVVFEANIPTVVLLDRQPLIITLCTNAVLRIDVPLFPGAPALAEVGALETVATLNGHRVLLVAGMFYCLSPMGTLCLSSLTPLKVDDYPQVLAQRLRTLCTNVAAARQFLIEQPDILAAPTFTRHLLQHGQRDIRW